MNAAPMRHAICFSATASCHKYGKIAQSLELVGGVGSAATGLADASAVLLSLRYELLRESYDSVAAAEGGLHMPCLLAVSAPLVAVPSTTLVLLLVVLVRKCLLNLGLIGATV